MRPFLFATLLGCHNPCLTEGPVDYTDDANWLCRPGVDRACPERWTVATVDTTGAITEATVRRPDTGLVCFSLYPTLDLTPVTGLHHDTTAVAQPETFTRIHSAQFGCEVYAPVYRQAKLGTYLGTQNKRKSTCFDSAYADVLAAFEAFVEAEPERPFALFGHSQGGQLISRLVAGRIESDPDLSARMVVAYPIGWPVGTAPEADVGGSFGSTPVCTAGDQSNCVVGFRTYVEGRATPTAGQFMEGETPICVNPASPDAPEATAVLDYTMVAGHAVLETPDAVSDGALVRWSDAVEASCAGDGLDRGLQIRWIRDDPPPVDLDNDLLTGGNGSHTLDLNFTEAALVADLARRAEAFGR